MDRCRSDDSRFFALTTHRDHRDKLVWAVFTEFIQYSERNMNWEIRRASTVNGRGILELWGRLGEEFSIVTTLEELAVLTRYGGNALLEQQFAKNEIAGLLAPYECVKDNATSLLGSYIPTGELAEEDVARRAPARRLRMQVLKRDDFRCVICGRRSRDHIDIELHVHHVLPWRFFGPTAEWNLATLCGTCHTGLDPDYEPEVRELAGLPGTDHPYYRHPPTPRNIWDIGDLTDNFLFLSGEVQDFLGG